MVWHRTGSSQKTTVGFEKSGKVAAALAWGWGEKYPQGLTVGFCRVSRRDWLGRSVSVTVSRLLRGKRDAVPGLSGETTPVLMFSSASALVALGITANAL